MQVATSSAAAGRDEFLNLLVTQLRHQDPLEPVKQEDFLAQLAQFSTLEGIEQLNGNLEGYLEAQSGQLHIQNLSGATNLIGEAVTYKNPDYQTTDGDAPEEEFLTGVVEAVVVDGSEISLRINETDVSLSDVDQIGIELSDLGIERVDPLDEATTTDESGSDDPVATNA